ncbi:YihY/virulence factor BrkB family protein [Cyclobacterium marinum]|uniref:Ribonuclease BN n=1 Tax=Cyclobacterium marinum (strain ATCC 25205 / DSM 745 / LMG 13164 / NCIMB 1802) TaxID=880070 RepID=G0J632_CYCMS|nr:YihY/virulence factor BrkB family protein [Cyclobacterium marinum]AEL26095.1 ribonuclease BN [Cyclobacterium marinum DSM 745]MBI0399457.1 YihY/virulence factor BrkB family protein [Cyclobacterium marinum]
METTTKEQKYRLKDTWSLLKATYKEWSDDDAFGNAASVAYYAVFSLPGLLLIIVSIIGLFMDRTDTVAEITSGLTSMIGAQSAESIAEILVNANIADQSVFMSIVGVGTMLFGATGLFVQLQKSLNSIWEVKKNENAGFITLLKDRATSLGIIIVIGFLLLLSLVLSTVIASLGNWLTRNFSESLYLLAYIANIILSIVIIALLFAAIFKILPDVKIKWRMVWIGAILTSILFTIGKALIALYLSESNPGATFGAAGAIILFLLWISYSCLILFFGAEFTQVFGRRYGYQFEPSSHAVRTSDFEQKKDKLSKREKGDKEVL